jgi:hypothetical protein
MCSRLDSLRALTLLSCHLTLAASGDDFNLARLIFPSASAGAQALPLDDPNTDFVNAADSWTALPPDGGRGCAASTTGSTLAGTDLTPAPRPASLAGATAGRRHFLEPIPVGRRLDR